MPVSSLVAVIAASEIVAPDASVATPEMRLVVPCARPETETANSTKTDRIRFIRSLREEPSIRWTAQERFEKKSGVRHAARWRDSSPSSRDEPIPSTCVGLCKKKRLQLDRLFRKVHLFRKVM